MLNNFILHLSLIENIGPATVNLVLKNCFNYDKNLPKVSGLDLLENSESLKTKILELYNYSSHDWLNKLGCTIKIAERLAVGLRDQTALLQELKLIEDSQDSNKPVINWLTIIDPKYPKLLKQLPHAPVVLYWWGDYTNLTTKALAVVGSRQANNYAWQVLTKLIPSLIAQDWVIVSGGAIGADTMAHRISLQNQGRTVAVLGSGLLQAYPSSNKQLFQDIIANNGTVLSPFSLNRPAMVGNFPARNNIISGLSLGTVVVQAAIKSGARITAECALSQGRELFVVPGLYGDELSAGCHALVSEGAKLIHCTQDILDEFEPNNLVNLTRNLAQPQRVLPTEPQQNTNLESTNLTAQIALACRKAASTDDLLDQFSTLDLDSLQSILFDLQLNGQVAQNFAGLWQSLNH